MSRQTTIFYEIKGNLAYVAYLFVNQKNIERIKLRRVGIYDFIPGALKSDLPFYKMVI